MQHRKWIAAALSLLTIFGGHWVNKRWDRILLFVLLTYLLPLAYFVLLSGLHTGSTTTITFKWYGWIIGALCLASAGTAYMDATATQEGIGSKLINGIVGSLFTVAGIAVVVSVVYVLRYIPQIGDYTDHPTEIVDKAPDLATARGFLDTTGMSYGEFDYGSNKLLGTGNASIVGKVTANNRPVEGLKLRLKVKPDIRTRWVTTDATGQYALDVPPGRYEYMGYDFYPKSADTLLGGMIMLDDDRMWTVFIRAKSGETVSGIDFRFADAIDITGPLAGDEVKVDAVEFSWQPYAGADHYTFMIYPRGKDGHAGGYPLMLGGNIPSVDVKETSLAPKAVGMTLNPGEYYEWELRAYDKDKRLLSKAPNLHDERLFRAR